MKKTVYFIVFALCSFLMLAGCTTTSKKTEKESPYLTTLGDFSPFKLGEALSLWKSGDDVSPCEMTLYCVPRTNKIEIYFSKYIDKICLMLDAEACEGFEENLKKYMEDYKEGHFDRNHNPTRANSYGIIKPSIAWGVFGYSYNADIKAYLNYEIIGGKPYFSMLIDQGTAKGHSDIFSPIMTMYFTPSQLETIMELTDPSIIAEHIKESEAEAYSFDFKF